MCWIYSIDHSNLTGVLDLLDVLALLDVLDQARWPTMASQRVGPLGCLSQIFWTTMASQLVGPLGWLDQTLGQPWPTSWSGHWAVRTKPSASHGQPTVRAIRLAGPNPLANHGQTANRDVGLAGPTRWPAMEPLGPLSWQDKTLGQQWQARWSGHWVAWTKPDGQPWPTR